MICSLLSMVLLVGLPAWTFFRVRGLRARVELLEGEVGRLRVEVLRLARSASTPSAAPRVEQAPELVDASAEAEPAPAPSVAPVAEPPEPGATSGASGSPEPTQGPPVETDGLRGGAVSDGPTRGSGAVEPVAEPSGPGGADVVPGLGVSAERLGLYALAAVGGSAAVLAALFALREVIAAGLLGAGARFALACIGGVGAWAVAEILRARRIVVPAVALSGAGAGILQAALWAGHVRYGVLDAQVALAGMVAVTAVTLFVAERRDSAFMALLAAGGGYAAPVLLSSGENRAFAFFAYLMVLTAGVLHAAARRGWVLVAGACVGAVALLYLGWVGAWRAPDQAYVGLAAPLLLGGVFLWAAWRRVRVSASGTSDAFALTSSLGAALVWSCALPFLVPAQPLRPDPRSYMDLPWTVGAAGWAGAAYVAVVGFLLARAWRGAAAGRALAAVVSTALAAVHVVGWGIWTDVLAPSGSGGWGPAIAALLALPVALVVAGAPGGAAYAAVMVAVVASLVGAFGEPPWSALAWAGAVLTVGGILTALRCDRRRLLLPLVVPAAVLAAAPVLAAGGWAAFTGTIGRDGLPEVAYDGGWLLAVALAYTVSAHAGSLRPRRDDLGGALAGALAGLLFFVPLRAAWLAHLGPSALGALPVLLGLGAAVAVVALVRIARVREDSRELAVLVAAALLFAALAVPMQLERQWLTLGWAVEVALLALATRRVRHPLLPALVGVLALVSFARLVGLPHTWAWGGAAGPLFLNWTLYTFGVPVVCYLLAANWLRVGPRATAVLPTLLRVLAGVAGFALVNAEVAHAFAHDGELAYRSERLFESMTRSLVWAAYGLLLIGIGAWRGSRAARLAGLGVAMLGAGKVFVVDLWSLEGLARVGSLAGLALTLLVGAVAFSRIVSRAQAAEGKKG